MAVGSYGIVRPADVSPDDVEILYHYAADRVATTDVTLKKLTSNDFKTSNSLPSVSMDMKSISS